MKLMNADIFRIFLTFFESFSQTRSIVDDASFLSSRRNLISISRIEHPRSKKNKNALIIDRFSCSPFMLNKTNVKHVKIKI